MLCGETMYFTPVFDLHITVLQTKNEFKWMFT